MIPRILLSLLSGLNSLCPPGPGNVSRLLYSSLFFSENLTVPLLSGLTVIVPSLIPRMYSSLRLSYPSQLPE